MFYAQTPQIEIKMTMIGILSPKEYTPFACSFSNGPATTVFN